MSTMEKQSLLGLSPDALKAALIAAGVAEKAAPMRVRQLWNWIYVHGARDFASMTNLAKDFRAQLDERFTLARPEIVTEQISNDGTRKWLLRTGARHGIRDRVHSRSRTAARSACRRRSAARSTAASATPARRSWCAISRPAEIVGQVMIARDALGDWPSTAPRPHASPMS